MQVRRKLLHPLLLLSLGLLTAAVTFFLIEGFASTATVLREIIRYRPIAERAYTRYDEEIGWINRANVHVTNIYGQGKHVKVNSQLFRNHHDFTVNPGPDKVRIVCSGDSFTFGYGVGNEHTWCKLLSSSDKRLETVNMGQGGYGVDQAYLWYKRSSSTIEHDIHLFAFVTEDFARMERDNFLGYGKPMLELRDGVLITKNTSVPKTGFYVPWLTHALNGFRNLSSLRDLRNIHESVISRTGPANDQESTPKKTDVT